MGIGWNSLLSGLGGVIVGALICAIVSLAFATHVWQGFIYGMCITMMCWFFIDGGRTLAAMWVHRREAPGGATPQAAGRWPGWRWMFVVLLVGTIVGYSAGNLLGNWITGRNSPGFFNSTPRQALALLVGALLPGIAVTYYFYSRGRIETTEALGQKAQREAAENQLKLLESQLEPHMLFNTLANLRVLIGIDPPRAQLMLDRLIAFLRATLNGSRGSWHSLSAEFERVNDYLELMRIRMGDRLQPSLELPADLADQRVPPLLLQPLVENAIKHGLEPHVSGGRLIVSASREGEQLVLCVRDTGAGLSAAGSDGTRFGLMQVRERLATLYGDDATLELKPADDAQGGTLAVIRMPASPP